MLLEVIQDALPPGALLLDRMRRLAVEGHAHSYALGQAGKVDPRLAAAERVFDQSMLHDLGISPGEVEPDAAVLRFHARGEGAAHSQIHRGRGRMPVIGCGIPLLDILRPTGAATMVSTLIFIRAWRRAASDNERRRECAALPASWVSPRDRRSAGAHIHSRSPPSRSRRARP